MNGRRLVGHALAHYRITAAIGAGGMGGRGFDSARQKLLRHLMYSLGLDCRWSAVNGRTASLVEG